MWTELFRGLCSVLRSSNSRLLSPLADLSVGEEEQQPRSNEGDLLTANIE